eukprot:4649211-Pleurochrysis_carterae.AAC.3
MGGEITIRFPCASSIDCTATLCLHKLYRIADFLHGLVLCSLVMAMHQRCRLVPRCSALARLRRYLGSLVASTSAVGTGLPLKSLMQKVGHCSCAKVLIRLFR